MKIGEGNSLLATNKRTPALQKATDINVVDIRLPAAATIQRISKLNDWSVWAISQNS